MRKPVAVFLILAVILMFQCNVFAEADQENSSLILTLDECMDKAIAYNHHDEILKQQLEDLWEQHNELFAMSHAIQEQLDVLDRYEFLYDKSIGDLSLTIDEENELLAYQTIFGPKPPVYSSTQMYEQFIKNRDIPHYSVWAAIQNIETSRRVISASIESGVKQIFDGLIDMQDMLTIQEQLYENMKKQNEQMLTRYNKGMVSEINKYMSDCALEKQKLSIDKTKRSIDNMMMLLKQQIGIPLNQEIELSYVKAKGVKQANTYNTYLNKALSNRNEILTAKMDLQTTKRENDIMKQYITNELLVERMESDMALDEKQIAYDEAVNNVTLDISYGYKDVQLKFSNFFISIEKLQNAERQYKEAEMRYEKGLISLADLWNVEISYSQAKLEYNRAMRDNNNAVYKLNAASGIGPGYASGGY